MAVHAYGRPGTSGAAVVGHRPCHLVVAGSGGRGRSDRPRHYVAIRARGCPSTGSSLAARRQFPPGLEPYYGRVAEPSTPAVKLWLSRTLARATPIRKQRLN